MEQILNRLAGGVLNFVYLFIWINPDTDHYWVRAYICIRPADHSPQIYTTALGPKLTYSLSLTYLSKGKGKHMISNIRRILFKVVYPNF